MVEECKEVFSNLATLSETLELELQEDSFTELLAVQHEKLTNEVLELEAQRKDRERQEEDVIEERQRFRTQEMAKGFSSSGEALLVFEAQDPNTKCTQRLQQPFRIQSSSTMLSMMRKKELLLKRHWIIF